MVCPVVLTFGGQGCHPQTPMASCARLRLRIHPNLPLLAQTCARRWGVPKFAADLQTDEELWTIAWQTRTPSLFPEYVSTCCRIHNGQPLLEALQNVGGASSRPLLGSLLGIEYVLYLKYLQAN